MVYEPGQLDSEEDEEQEAGPLEPEHPPGRTINGMPAQPIFPLPGRTAAAGDRVTADVPALIGRGGINILNTIQRKKVQVAARAADRTKTTLMEEEVVRDLNTCIDRSMTIQRESRSTQTFGW